MGFIRDRRNELGLKLREVAEHCGVDIRSVTDWERKDRIPKTKNAIAASKLLKLPIERVS